MVLTEEQKERIRKNRERALEIQKRRREELEAKNKGAVSSQSQLDVSDGSPRKKMALDEKGKGSDGGEHGGVVGGEEVPEEEMELEEFEVGASKHVTKKEAMKMYLIPEGTLTVCKFEEKPNPHNKKFQPMKLYDRAEIRRLSRERFGGLQGLIEERKRRQDKRFQKDLEETKDLFRR